MSAASKKGGQRLWALFTETPQLAEAELAAHHIERHIEQRDRHPIGSRPWHVERVKLAWRFVLPLSWPYILADGKMRARPSCSSWPFYS